MLAIDTETELIDVGKKAPPIVCVSFASTGADPSLHHVKESKQLVEYALATQSNVTHNAAFDMSCIMAQWPDLIPAVFKAYDEGRVSCTEIRARLIDVGKGCHETYYRHNGKNRKITYKLSGLVERFFDHKLQGKGDTQLDYGRLIDVPLEAWPSTHVAYAKGDAAWCLALHEMQSQWPEYLVDETRQTKAALCLYLTSTWGLNTNASRVAALRAKVEAEYASKVQPLLDANLLRVGGTKKKPKLVKCEKNARARYITCGGAEKSKGGSASLAGEHLKATGDPLLITYAEAASLSTQLSTQIPALELGAYAPLHTRFIALRNTGRTSSQKPNVQNQSRRGGFRECFEPRPGHHYYQSDYNSFELFCLAQVCIYLLGGSSLGEALNAGMDPHCEIASRIMGVSYSEAVRLYKAGDPYADDCRQTGKIANFGLPGGLSAAALVEFAKAIYDVVLTIEQAHNLKDIWLSTWSEMPYYFDYIRKQVGRRSMGDIVQVYSNRIRGKCRFTQAANTLFQGLAADAAKDAYWLIIKACYAEPQSPLYGTRIVNFIHDEFMGEAPIDRAAEAAEELSRLMVVGAQPLLPDMRIKAEPCIMKFWSKNAQTLRDQNGRLQAWPLAS